MFFLAFLLFGLAISIQVRSVWESNKQKSASELKLDELKQQLNDEIKKGDVLRADIEKNELNFNNQLQSYAESQHDTYLDQLIQELDALRFISGFTNVEGKGIVVTLNDAPARKAANPNAEIIHDFDIVHMINELKKLGAQAISINGERVIATSEQMCAGPTVRINKRKYPVPYVIQAIGSPDNLQKVMESGKVAELKEYNIRIDIKRADKLLVPGYIGITKAKIGTD